METLALSIGCYVRADSRRLAIQAHDNSVDEFSELHV